MSTHSLPTKKAVEVALALIWHADQLLITRRPAHVHLGGSWEFPGGKILPGESAVACAEREVLEELGMRITAQQARNPIAHPYPERVVTLHPVDCSWSSGEPQLLGVSDARWVTPAELNTYPFPTANAGLIAELIAQGCSPFWSHSGAPRGVNAPGAS
jgi:mutator protein MutT